MRSAFATHNVNRAISGLWIGPKQAICAVRRASQKLTFAMRYVFTALCLFAAEPLRCRPRCKHPCGAMPRCGERRFGGRCDILIFSAWVTGRGSPRHHEEGVGGFGFLLKISGGGGASQKKGWGGARAGRVSAGNLGGGC